MMTAEQLKNSILQLALQGKLVEQRPEEGTGEELYTEIQIEKKRLIKEGKIKKQKPILDITEEEIPFDIPGSWRWARILEISSVINGDRGKNYPSKSSLSHEGIPFISALNLDGRTIIEDDSLLCVSQEQYDRLGSGKLKKGDIVVCIRGSLGKHGRYPFEKGAIASSLVICRQYIKSEVTALFIMSYLDAPLFFEQIKQYDNGTAQPNLAAKSLEQFVIPLPPLAEQKRIVAKIEELMPFVEQYAAASTKLNTLNATFPEMMKKSILQEAVQGKLVPQDPNDEPASVLLKKIAEEKKQLIKEGKIKKQKLLPEITEDEIPFDIPESWEWIRLGDLTELITKGSSPKWQGINYVNEGLLFVTSENVGVEELLWSNKKYVDFRFNDISPRSILKKGDLLTNIVGASIGRTAVYDLDEVANINQAVCLIRLINQDLAPYILMHLNSPIAYRIMMADKVETARPNISLTNIAEFLVPLPPLKEQKRIIEKLRIIDEHIKRLCLN